MKSVYDKRQSVFVLDYADGSQVLSAPCEWLEQAIAKSGRRGQRPIAAAFWYGEVLTNCTQAGIGRAMAALRIPAIAA